MDGAHADGTGRRHVGSMVVAQVNDLVWVAAEPGRQPGPQPRSLAHALFAGDVHGVPRKPGEHFLVEQRDELFARQVDIAHDHQAKFWARRAGGMKRLSEPDIGYGELPFESELMVQRDRGRAVAEQVRRYLGVNVGDVHLGGAMLRTFVSPSLGLSGHP